MQNTWLVGNALGGSKALRMAVDFQKAGRGGLVPWAGVAAQLPSATHVQVQPADSEQKEDEQSPADMGLSGQAFCFLPLPCQTGNPSRIPVKSVPCPWAKPGSRGLM